MGIVYLDLDNFKKINDAYGHMFGDQLLQAVSLALLSCLEEDQLLARLGAMNSLSLLPIRLRARWKQWPHESLPDCGNRSVLGSLKFTRAAPLAFRWPPSTYRTVKVSFATPTPQCITLKKVAAVSFAFFAGNESARI